MITLRASRIPHFSAILAVHLALSCRTQVSDPAKHPDDTGTVTDTSTPPPIVSDLPILPAGNHLGVWPTYEAPPEVTAAALEDHWQRSLSSGMRIARVHVGWDQIELAPGRFDTSQLVEDLGAATADGLAVHLLIETVDSDGLSLPSDLVVEGEPYGLVDGRRLDDPLIVDRFTALLDAVVPILDRHDVFAISVANEPDCYLDDVAPDSAEGLAWVESLAGFLTSARERVQESHPEIGVAMTLRQGSLEKGIDTLGPIIEAGDVAVFNYYCQDLSFQVQPASVVSDELEELVSASSGRPIVLQEMGCPAGAIPSTIGATEAQQADFYAEVGRWMASREEIRAAFAFQMVDWSPELSAAYAEAYAEAGYPELGAQIAEILGTIGLLRYTDGSERPAWDAFETALSQVEVDSPP